MHILSITLYYAQHCDLLYCNHAMYCLVSRAKQENLSCLNVFVMMYSYQFCLVCCVEYSVRIRNGNFKYISH